MSASSSSGDRPLNAAGALAHDIFNLLTVAYGLQDEIEKLAGDDELKRTIVDRARIVSERLEIIGRRLVAISRISGRDDALTSPGGPAGPQS